MYVDVCAPFWFENDVIFTPLTLVKLHNDTFELLFIMYCSWSSLFLDQRGNVHLHVHGPPLHPQYTYQFASLCHPPGRVSLNLQFHHRSSRSFVFWNQKALDCADCLSLLYNFLSGLFVFVTIKLLFEGINAPNSATHNTGFTSGQAVVLKSCYGVFVCRISTHFQGLCHFKSFLSKWGKWGRGVMMQLKWLDSTWPAQVGWYDC